MREKVLASFLGLLLLTFVLIQPSKTEAHNLELGIFLPNIYGNNIDELEQLENQLGVNFDTVKIYLDWLDNLPTSTIKKLENHGALTEITWQPQINNVGIIYSDVADGNYDNYLDDFSQRVASLDCKLRITLAPEMNGDWASWWVGGSGNSPSSFISFWRYVVDKFGQNGADNVEWVWSPNVHYWGEKYSFSQYFPGDAYVGYTGLEGYNWGTSQTWSEWQSFREVFYSSYRDLVNLSSKSILITETASSEKGGDKAAWIKKMFADLNSVFPRIKGFTWFNMNKETDWRIQSSPASKLAFINGIIKALPIENRPNDVFINEQTNTFFAPDDLEENSSVVRSEKVMPLALLIDPDNHKQIASFDDFNEPGASNSLGQSLMTNQDMIFWFFWTIATMGTIGLLLRLFIKSLI